MADKDDFPGTPAPIVTRDDLVTVLNAAIGNADRCDAAMVRTVHDIAAMAINRNYALASIKVYLPEADRARMANAADQQAMSDYHATNRLAEAVQKLASATDGVSRVRDAVESVFEATEAPLRRQIADLSARLREHAIGDPAVRERVWTMTDGKCWHCDCELINGGPIANPADRPRLFHVDHLVAKANGGPDHISNYVPACERCNISKGARSYVEFTRKRQVAVVAVETETPQVASK